MRDIMDQAESNVTYETTSLTLLRKARQLILTQSPVGRTHDELIKFVDETITKLGDVTNSEKHEQEIQFSMHEFDRAVRLFALVRSRIAEMLTLIADSRSAYLKAQMLMEDVCDAAKGAHGTEVLKEAEQSICGIKDAMDRLQRARETLVLAAAEAATTAEDRIRAAEALHEVTVIVGPIAGAKEIEEESLIHRKSLQRRLTAGDGR